jgi:hypothetical protein
MSGKQGKKKGNNESRIFPDEANGKKRTLFFMVF